MTHATLITNHDPFHPGMHRDVRIIESGCALAELAPETDQAFIMLINGAPILRRDWDVRIKSGDLVNAIVLPHDFGGGDGKNPLALILTIAVFAIAPEIGAYVGLMTGSETLAIAAQIGFGMLGSQLINAVLPPPKPTTPQQAQALAAPSPTYNLSAQGNLARLDAAIPVHYGRCLAYPDFAAQPYLEYAGNEQYLYQLLCLGQGEYDIEQIRIEDTPISSWEEINYEIVGPGQQVTLFPANVATSGEVSGQEIIGLASGSYSQSGTTITVTLTGHALTVGKHVYLDFTSGSAVDGEYTLATVPDADHFTVTASSATTSGGVNVRKYLGPFVANASGTQANVLAVDFVMPRGLYYYDGSNPNPGTVSVSLGIEARPINDAGSPIGSWSVLETPTISAATTTPQRYSYRYPVTAGRYEVRAYRSDVKQTSGQYGHEAAWAGLRAYLPETADYGEVTLIALRMRASNNLSQQASRKINVIATRKVPVWNGTAWSVPVASTSIAWAIADACRDSVYGAGLPDSMIDLSGLLTLDATWTARGDQFNGRFDNSMVFWEVMTKIAQAGRAKAFMQGGLVRVARDEHQSIPVAMFTTRNIARGSFSVSYMMPTEETADVVEVSYFDSDVWTNRRVQAALPGSASAKPAKIDLFGVTDRDQAYREGLYHAATNYYRRKLISFATEMEGYIPALGDLIAISHDMPQWGQTSEATAWNAGTKTLTLSEPMTWGVGTHYVGIRTLAGALEGPYAVTAGATAYEVVLAVTPTTTPYVGSAYERTHVTFGWGETWRQLARVVSVRPRSLTQIEIVAVNEDESVHTADEGVTAPAANSSQLPTRYTAPVVSGLTLRSSPSDIDTMLISWRAAAGADSYLIEQSSDGETWTRTGDTRATNYIGRALYGASTIVRVAGIGMTIGPWVQALYSISAGYMWHTDGTAMWTADGNLMWT